MNCVLSTAYLPPIEYLACCFNGNIIIEQHENFIKQTYRNRALIPSSEGVLMLSIPIKKMISGNCPIKDIQIDYSQHWQRMHWRAMESVYNSAPFFLFYKDYFYPFYHQQNIKFLFDFNCHIMQVLFKLLNLNKTLSFTEDFISEYTDKEDYRNIINPKIRLKNSYKFANIPSYRQVFSDRIGFQKNMSIVDLLFNEGRCANEYLKNLF